MKSRCQVCDPSCNLEVRGYSATLPVACPFDTGYTPEWKQVTTTKAEKKVKAKRVKIVKVKKVESDAAAKARSLLF
jgi:hypothetical protein